MHAITYRYRGIIMATMYDMFGTRVNIFVLHGIILIIIFHLIDFVVAFD